MSQGACGVSSEVDSPRDEVTEICEESEICRECGLRKAGDAGLGAEVGDPDMRVSKRRSNGFKEGLCFPDGEEEK